MTTLLPTVSATRSNALLRAGAICLGLAFFQAPLRAATTEPFDSLTWYASNSALSLATDTTLDSSNQVLAFSTSTGAVVVGLLSSALTATATTPVTLSFSFRDIGGGGFKMGLFNDAGTGVTTSTGTGGVNTTDTDDYGSFLRLSQTAAQPVLESQATSSGNLFFTSIASGTSATLGSSLGSGVHTFTLTESLSGSTYTMAYQIDGVSVGSVSTTNAMFATIDEIAFCQISTPASIEFANVSVTAVPEPPGFALLGLACAGAAGIPLFRHGRRDRPAPAGMGRA